MPSAVLESLDLIAHDLRNEINLLVSGSNLLVTSTDDESAEIASDMVPAARWLAFWADLTIEAARVELGTTADREAGDLGELVSLAQKRAVRALPALTVESNLVENRNVATIGNYAERVIAASLVLFGGSKSPTIVAVQDAENDVVLSISGSTSIESGPKQALRPLIACLAARASIAFAYASDTKSITLRFEGSV